MNMVDTFMERFSQKAPIYFKSVNANRRVYPELFDRIAERLLKIAQIHLGPSVYDVLIDGYCFFVDEVNSAQFQYEKTGHYANHSYTEVYAKTYNNPAFMKEYHWGVFATVFGWEHHLLVCDFFCSNFIALNKDKNGQHFKGLDLGCGSGLWHLLAMEYLPLLNFEAVDISTTSIGICNKSKAALGMDGRVVYHCADATSFHQPEVLYDLGISCLVLEHLEQPEKLLLSLAKNLKAGAYAFVTCALTAAEIDHVFEFKYEYEAAKMASDAGFRLCQLTSLAPKKISPKSKYLPRTMAMILQKKRNDIW